jgi:archaellum component FlaF (FlaF/FlaG flagellin family)
VLFTNNGTANLSISQISAKGTGFSATGLALPVTVPVGQSASLAVSFSPLTAGSATGSVTVLSNAANTPSATIALSGAGTAQTLQLSPSATNLNFGNILVGTTSSSSAVTFTNTGNTSVSISQVKVTGSGFTASGIPAPSSLAPGQLATLTVNFDPSVTGAATGSVSVVSNATNSPASIGLAGSGVQPQLSLQPGTVAFGNVPVGSTNTQTMTISNPGSATLNISQSSVSGAGFSITGLTLPLNVAPGTMSSFTLSYTPAGAGTVSGTLKLVSNAPVSPANFVLSGSGVAQTSQLSASPVSLSFASTAVGSSSASQTVTLSNTGNAAVTISKLTSSSTAFGVTGLSLPLNLAAGQFTNFSVLFAPLTAGSLSGSISVASTATNSPTIIALSGLASQVTSSSVNLTWSDSSTVLSGFNVYRGATTGGPYAKINPSLTPSTSYTDSSVQSGSTYYYVTTAVDTTGAESSYSNESAATIP